MNSLLLIRGLPGSGKSTLSKLLSEQFYCPVFSIDDFFTDKNTGTYLFEFDKNHLAYKQCEEKTLEAMQCNTPFIIVENTFTMEWEMQPYVAMAKEFNYQLFVSTVEKYHEHSNVHGITDEQIEKMAAKFKVKLY
jgi:predicted kinase